MAAELAVVLPAVALVLGVCVWGVQLAAQQVRLQDAAGLAARAAARGDPLELAAAAGPRGLELASWSEGELVCASAALHAAAPLGLTAIPLSAEACALREGP